MTGKSWEVSQFAPLHHALAEVCMYSPSYLLEELLEVIVKTLVDHPDEVEVRSVVGQQVIVLELRVHPEDVGQVIGHHGRIAEALRTILGAVGTKLQKRVTVEILE
jgi:predicted RNA-binding protein YlqC (UPF0109 family)